MSKVSVGKMKNKLEDIESLNKKFEQAEKTNEKGIRDSNLELFRIIIMICIVAHHYVVNSGLIQLVTENLSFSANNVFLLLFGWGGKTGINCFVLITGYFMCKSQITAKKFLKLIGTWYFYKLAIYAVFLITGYESFSFKVFVKTVLPFYSVQQNFTACYVLFYLFIPFLSKLVQTLNEREHRLLLLLCLSIYTVLPSISADVSFNYVTWFTILFLLAAYLRFYPRSWFGNVKLWGALTAGCLILSWMSVVCTLWIMKIIGRYDIYYFFVSDSNKVLPVVTAVCTFMLFKNLKIKPNKMINMVAGSTFSVLLIHAASDTMRQWLWYDIFKNVSIYQSPWLVLHAVGTVLIVYVACTGIDIIRLQVMSIYKKKMRN